MKAFMPLPALLFAVMVIACNSVPAAVPEDMPPAKIIQKAQEASDVNKYKAALRYYEVLLERYGDMGEYLSTARYEIAFIYYKQKRYADARREFESLLALYRAEGAEDLLPQFRTLSEKVLTRIREITKEP